MPCRSAISSSGAIYIPNERLRQGRQWSNTTTYKKSRFSRCSKSSDDGQLFLWESDCYLTALVRLQQQSRVTGGGVDVARSRSLDIIIGGRWAWKVTSGAWAQNPILCLIPFLLLLHINDFVPLESRGFQPQTSLIFSAREVGLCLQVLLQRSCLVHNCFVEVHGNMFEGDTSLFDRLS